MVVGVVGVSDEAPPPKLLKPVAAAGVDGANVLIVEDPHVTILLLLLATRL